MKRSAFLWYVILFAVEQLLACVPLFRLRHLTSVRLAAVEAKFQLLPEEIESAETIDMLIACSIVGFLIVIPMLQILLASLYFFRGHPWSRLLRNHVKLTPFGHSSTRNIDNELNALDK